MEKAEKLAIAIAVTSSAFVGELDKGGQPYILHCLRVMDSMPKDDHELMSIAVMHDIIEDTWYKPQDLLDLGFSDRVVKGVVDLTRYKDINYDLYIRNVASNKDATIVKLADLRDNLDPTRLKGLTKKDHDRVEKYHRSYTYLSKI